MIRLVEYVLAAVIASFVSICVGSADGVASDSVSSLDSTCVGCKAIPDDDKHRPNSPPLGWSMGAKLHVATPGFSVTGEFKVVSSGFCDPATCAEDEPCRFQATWIVKWPGGSFVESPPCTELGPGLHIGAHPIKVCGCLPNYCFDEKREFFGGSCPVGVSSPFLGDIHFRGDCTPCVLVQPPN